MQHAEKFNQNLIGNLEPNNTKYNKRINIYVNAGIGNWTSNDNRRGRCKWEKFNLIPYNNEIFIVIVYIYENILFR